MSIDIGALLKTYDTGQITIGVLGSHSALEVCRGASKEGLRTLVVAQKGRDKTYSNYYQKQDQGARTLGCIDEILLLDRFSDVLAPETQQAMRERNVVFVPHRSFEAYTSFDYDTIEDRFQVPMLGNRYMLRLEERGSRPNQYDLLAAAKIPYPRQFEKPEDIDRLVLVKVLEAERGFERAFFFASSYEDYRRKVDEKLSGGVITEEGLQHSVIEEYVLGVQVNFNFFYSPIGRRLELLGTDTRRQTNHEGFMRLPGRLQAEALEATPLKFEEAGHIAVTVLESLLEPALEQGERFVAASQELAPPGIVGPFALQSIVTAGPPKKEIVVIDVSPRMPGSPGIAASPYSDYLYGEPISMGRRVAMEIKDAIEADALTKVVT